MKKVLLFAFSLSLLTACGKSNSPKKLAEEVCECSKKANAMDAADPKRSTAQADCQKKQVEAWDKVKGNMEKADEFNKVLGDCAKEQIENTLGK